MADGVEERFDRVRVIKAAKKFDCVKFMREARARIYEETKHMSHEELAEYWREYRENDPLWQRLTAIEEERANASNQESRRVLDSD